MHAEVINMAPTATTSVWQILRLAACGCVGRVAIGRVAIGRVTIARVAIGRLVVGRSVVLRSVIIRLSSIDSIALPDTE